MKRHDRMKTAGHSGAGWRKRIVRSVCRSASPVVLSLLLTCSLGAAAEPHPIDVVVVRPKTWSAALQDWKAYRTQQGYNVVEIDADLGRGGIRRAILDVAREHPRIENRSGLQFVMLAGDVTANRETNVPTFYHQSTAMVQFGGDPLLASDNPYGDLDGDHIPDIAVGRIPADSAEQLAQVLKRTIDFERNDDYSSWRRDVHIVAGVGGFGLVADSMIEMTTRHFLANRIPGWVDLSMTQASLQSYYCPDPRRFSETCIDRMNQGGMFWVYIGHGHVKNLDYLRLADEAVPIMTNAHIPNVRTGRHPPIALFLACYTGAYDVTEDALAEKLVLSPSGPIAAIAASRISGPYGLAMLSDGLLHGCFQEQTRTLGEVILRAKQRSLRTPDASGATEVEPELESSDRQTELLTAVASSLSPKGYDLRAERMEHVWQVNLLGDPLLRLSRPSILEIVAPDSIAPGGVLPISFHCPCGGELTAELAYRRGRMHASVKSMQVDVDSRAGRDHYQQRYATANEICIVRSVTQVAKGPVKCQMRVPADLPRGKYRVRLFLAGDSSWSAGDCEIHVRKERAPKSTTSSAKADSSR